MLGSGLQIGDLVPGYASQGSVVVRFRVGGGIVAPPPVVYVPSANSRTVLTKTVQNLTFPNGTLDHVSAWTGNLVEYEIKLENKGTASTDSLTVKDTLPPSVIFVSATDGGIYNTERHEVVWQARLDSARQAGRLGAGESREYRVRVQAKEVTDNLVTQNQARVESPTVARKSNAVLVVMNTQPLTFGITPTGEQFLKNDQIACSVNALARSNTKTNLAAVQPAPILATNIGANVGASGVGSFFPQSFFGWVGIAILLIILVILVRRYFA